MKRTPLHTVRSQWHDVSDTVSVSGYVVAERDVHDGLLRMICADEPGIGWHLSISHRGHNGTHTRYPSWDEIADARDIFLPDELTFVMYLPPPDEYVSLHATTFHLHQHPAPSAP